MEIGTYSNAGQGIQEQGAVSPLPDEQCALHGQGRRE